MANCKYCGTDCPESGEHDRFFDCILYTDRKPTNADRIRGMTDEGISKLLESVGIDQGIYDMFCDDPKRKRLCDSCCDKCILDWLRQPAETEGD